MKTINVWNLALASGLALMASACGSEDPGGGAETTTSYFPMSDGAVSVYEHSSRGSWNETITLTGMSSGVFRESDTANPDGERNESVLEIDSAGRVVRTRKDAYVDGVLDRSVVYEPGFVRYDPAWLDLAVNESVREEYERTETPAGGNPGPTRPRAHLYTSYGFQPITVFGTNYNDCLVIHRQRDYNDPAGDPEDQQKQFYFCAGVGKVQEINVDSGNTEQLVSYSSGVSNQADGG